MRKNGFSIAEMLITAVLIGTIATLTVPSLVVNYHKMGRIYTVKKEYNALSEALVAANVKFGTIDKWYSCSKKECDESEADNPECGKLNCDKSEDLNLETAMKFADVSKLIGSNISTGSVGKWNHKNIDKVFAGSEELTNLPAYEHDDGTMFFFKKAESIDGNPYVEVLAVLPSKTLDKLKYGYDAFPFFIDFKNNKVVPSGLPAHSVANRYDFKGTDPKGATAWVVLNNNLDYIDCYDKLDWNKCTSCKAAKKGPCEDD